MNKEMGEEAATKLTQSQLDALLAENAQLQKDNERYKALLKRFVAQLPDGILPDEATKSSSTEVTEVNKVAEAEQNGKKEDALPLIVDKEQEQEVVSVSPVLVNDNLPTSTERLGGVVVNRIRRRYKKRGKGGKNARPSTPSSSPRTSKAKRARRRRRHRKMVFASSNIDLNPTTKLSASLREELKKLSKQVHKRLSSFGLPISVLKPEESADLTKQIEKIIASTDALDAFYIVNLGAIVEKFVQWKSEFPGIKPFYAVKSNPDINIMRTLCMLGTGFDCASHSEIKSALEIGATPDSIIYANPCKGKEHILFAKKHGVSLMTFDNASELIKISELYIDARLVLRILPDDSSSLCRLGTKFGADWDRSTSLINLCKKLKVNLVGISFHVGSSCTSADAHVSALELSHRIFDYATQTGFKLTFLDIGGGFPGHDEGDITFPTMTKAIKPVISKLFPNVNVIAEPGRFFCTSAYTLAVTVISRRDIQHSPVPPTTSTGEGETIERSQTLYYLSDGVYGSFNNVIFDHARVKPLTLNSSPSTNSPSSSKLFGPTCDSIDLICDDVELPELEVGEWLYFRNMGAYTVAAATTFNGFRTPSSYYVISC